MTTPGPAKAMLQPLKDVPGGTGSNGEITVLPAGPAVAVQFNPTTLRIDRGNAIDSGGSTVNTQHRQLLPQPAKLSVELEFDTAEGDENGNPKDVTERTAVVRQFVVEPKGKRGEPAPRVLFLWGNLRFVGIVTQANEELDYFNSDGIPLRAKVTLNITEQDLTLQAGPGSKDAVGATLPGIQLGIGLGASGSVNPTLVVSAQAGESAQQLLGRLDLDPANWRAAMNGLASPLSLTAGAQVELGAEVSASGGVGITAGFAAGFQAGATTELAAALDGAGSSQDATTPGFALAAGGGVAASLNTVLAQQTGSADAQARASFGAPTATAVPNAPVDTRALGYGRSIPLRARANAVNPSVAPPPSSTADAAQRSRDSRPSTMRWKPGGDCR
jgi:Contractile injection system tube protein